MNKLARALGSALFFCGGSEEVGLRGWEAYGNFLGILTTYFWASGELPAFLRSKNVPLLKIL